MKQGKSLVELAQSIQNTAEKKRDLVADTRQITMRSQDDSEPVIAVADDVLAPTDHCHKQIAAWSGIGTRYYQKMRDDSPALLAGNVNHWLHKEPEKGEVRRMVRSIDGKARAFLSDRYLRLDNEHVAETAFKALESVDDVQIASCDVTDSKLYIKAVFPRTQADVKVGDTVQSGVLISNSEIGLGSFNVHPFTHRLVCLNGMVTMVKGDGLTRRHLGARVQNGGIEYQQDTITAAAQAALLECRDAVTTFADPEYFKKQVERMQAAAESRPVERPVRAVEVLAKQVGLSDTESESVLERFIRDGDFTQWGMLNAVTNLANDVDDYDRASELETIGGTILQFPARNWDRIAVAA